MEEIATLDRERPSLTSLSSNIPLYNIPLRKYIDRKSMLSFMGDEDIKFDYTMKPIYY